VSEAAVKRFLPFDDLVILTLCTLYELVSGEGLFDVKASQLAQKIGFDVSPAAVSLALEQLAEKTFVRNQGRGDQMYSSLSPNGIREAENLFRGPEPLVRQYKFGGHDFAETRLIGMAAVPASDRIVSPADNQAAYDQSIESLTNLEIELKTSNEAGDIFGDDRDLVVRELSLLNSLISGARVRAEPAIALAKKSLGWIAEKAAGAAIGDMAKRALGYLMDWLSI
jgi:hypothetical protein